MLSLPQYAKIKDNYCISYFGNNKEYLIQLKVLRPFMENTLPGLKIFIACKKESMYLLENEERIISREELQENKKDFAYIREINCDMQCHPIEELMDESDIPYGPILAKTQISTKICGFLTNAVLPTRSLSAKQIEFIISYIHKKGYTPIMNSTENADWVIGVENEDLFQAGIDGKKVTLINTGLGENLFKKMFPMGEILNLPVF